MSQSKETRGSLLLPAQADKENERISLKHTFRFQRKSGDLDTTIHSFLGATLDMPLSQDENILTSEHVQDIIQYLPSVNLIKTADFFNRIPLPFLRCVMSIHSVDHVPHSNLTLLDLSEEEKSNTRLEKLLWFLLFVGSHTNEVSTLLEQHRSQFAEMHSSFRSNSSQG